MPFKPLSYKHAVPIPLDLEPNARARWISDVIVMDPICTWEVPNPPLLIPPEFWTANITAPVKVNISLPVHDIGAQVYLSSFRELVAWLR